MTISRVKIFRSSKASKLEDEINHWLAELSPKHAIQRTQTAMASHASSGASIVISVWYTEPAEQKQPKAGS